MVGYEIGIKYSACQINDVKSGLCIDQFHGTFGSETPIYIVDEREISGDRWCCLRIEKPGHESVFGWRRASELDGRLKLYDWEDNKTKGKK